MSVPKWKIYLPTIIGATAVLAITLGLIWLIYDSMHSDPPRFEKKIQSVNLVTPPPPPPKPKIERPPEPEIEEEVKINEPESLEDLPDLSDQSPPGDMLGLDAEGGAGGDGFGLIARKGGRGLLDGDPIILYASELQQMIEDSMLDNEHIRRKAYSIVVQIWVSENGEIERAKLSQSTGDREIDTSLVEMITGMPMMAQAPPAQMPQPIRLRISSRL